MYAWKFTDINIFISGEITNQSKIQYDRNIQERVKKLVPYLELDSDPYVVINDGKLKLEQLVKFLCENPVKIFGIKYKGYIKIDFDADFTIIDLKKVIEIKNENSQSKCGWSPFNGNKFKGTPVTTIVNGEIKMKNGKLLGQPSGKPMLF